MLSAPPCVGEGRGVDGLSLGWQDQKRPAERGEDGRSLGPLAWVTLFREFRKARNTARYCYFSNLWLISYYLALSAAKLCMPLMKRSKPSSVP